MLVNEHKVLVGVSLNLPGATTKTLPTSLRILVSAVHTDEQLETAAKAIREVIGVVAADMLASVAAAAIVPQPDDAEEWY